MGSLDRPSARFYLAKQAAYLEEYMPGNYRTKLVLVWMCLCCSDVICEYPLKEMLDFHKARNAEATILVTKVCARDSNPSPADDNLVMLDRHAA